MTDPCSPQPEVRIDPQTKAPLRGLVGLRSPTPNLPGIALELVAVGEVDRVGSVGVHEPEVVGPSPVADERDLLAVGALQILHPPAALHDDGVLHPLQIDRVAQR